MRFIMQLIFALTFVTICSVEAFTAPFLSKAQTGDHTRLFEAKDSDGKDPNDIVACRIKMEGAVQGGYFRACVKNEARRFRNLIGTMSPPSDDPKAEAEIYVEGKRKMVEGFVRWCKKGDVGLNQISKVLQVSYDEVPTGLYEDFYVETK